MDQPACEDSWTSHREVLFIPNYSTKQNMLLKCCNYAQNGSTKSTQSGHYIISDDADADDDNDLS